MVRQRAARRSVCPAGRGRGRCTALPRPLRLSAGGDVPRPVSFQRRQELSSLSSAGCPPRVAPGRGGYLLPCLGTERRARFRRRRVQPLGRTHPSDGFAGRLRRLGTFPSRRGSGHLVQVRDPQPCHGRGAGENRSLRPGFRNAAGNCRLRAGRGGACLGRCRLAGAPGAVGLAACARLDLRVARRFLEAPSRRPLLFLPRPGRAPAALCARHGVYAHRAAAGLRAPARRIVGLPDHRLFRADAALRQRGRLALLHRRLPPGRPRRPARLGAGPLPRGRFCAGALRRQFALRTRGPAIEAPPRLGHVRSSTTGATRSAAS